MVYQSLKKAIRDRVFISDDDLTTMLSFFKPLILQKNDYLLQVGQWCNQVAFVESGMLRVYYPNENGEETTCHFAQPNEFITSYAAFAGDKISTENIQAILPTECLAISKQDLMQLYAQVPAIQEFGRKTAEGVAMLMEKRLGFFLNHSADERYQFLLQNNAGIIRNVPLQYIASFLGITPQHLSRLRKKYD